MRGFIMTNTFNICMQAIGSFGLCFIIANLPTLQSFITFLVSIIFLLYKIKKVREEYKNLKVQNEKHANRKRH